MTFKIRKFTHFKVINALLNVKTKICPIPPIECFKLLFLISFNMKLSPIRDAMTYRIISINGIFDESPIFGH